MECIPKLLHCITLHCIALNNVFTSISPYFLDQVYLSKKNVQKWTDNEGFRPHKEWLLETDGTNLAEVMTFPAVNHRTTVSNDVLEMFQVLGIEGARSSLFNELRNVLSFDGAYVNYRHIALLADSMTFSG